MKTIHETKNPFSTSALRGGRLRKSGKGIISYAPFLMGASVIVLGSMFTLSAPPFANATCDDSTLSTAVETKTEITTTVTPDKVHTNAANGQVVTNTVVANDTYHDDHSYNHVDVVVTRTGVYNTTFTTSGSIDGVDSEYGAGVFVYRKGNGALCLVNNANIRDTENYGIEASRSGEGVLDISNVGNITNAGRIGIKASRAGDHDLKISSTGNIGAARGVYARHTAGGGNIEISLSGTAVVTAGGTGATSHGIEAVHNGTGEIDIDVLSERTEGSETKNIESTHGTGIRVEHTGGGNIAFESDGSVWGKASGVWVKQDRTGRVALLVRDDSWIHGDEQHGLYVNHIGGGTIDIDVQGGSSSPREGVTSRTGDAIKVINTGDNLIDIDIDGRVSSNVPDPVSGPRRGTSGKGIYAKHNGAGDIDIRLLGDGKVSSSDDDGIYAKHDGGGNITVGLERSAKVEGVLNAEHTSNGNVVIGLEGRSVAQNGIKVDHSGSGLVDIDIDTLSISAMPTNSPIPHSVYGINIQRGLASSGDVDVSNKSSIGRGIRIDHRGTGNVKVELHQGSRVFLGGGTPTIHIDSKGLIDIDIAGNTGLHQGVRNWYTHAIQARTTGSEAIEIDVSGRASTTFGSAIRALHRGTGNVAIDLKRGIFETQHLEAISAESSSGDINIIVGRVAEVKSIYGRGIVAVSNGGGAITIDVAGKVLRNHARPAIRMSSSNTKKLILHPGFVMSGNVLSEGAGKGVLELNRHAIVPSTEGTLNLDQLRGFEEFVKADGNVWVLTDQRDAGTTPYSNFKKAKITAGTLRFSSVEFPMASGRRRFFEVLDDSVLEIVGTNILKGNLKNSGRGDVIFKSRGNLTVKGNYKGIGDLIFDISGNNGLWDTQQKLLIEGIVTGGELSRPVFIRHSGSLSMGAGDSPWLVQQKSSVEEGENHFAIGGVITDQGKDRSVVSGQRITIGTNLYEFEHDHVNVPNGAETIRVNGWRLKFIGNRGQTASIIPDPNLGANDSRIDRNRRQSLENRRQPIALRDDVRGRAGDVWAEQGSSRTLQESGTISGGRLRTESNRVRFGFDLPAQSFVGGDVVLGAGVRQGFSVSDVSSPSDRSIIGVESHTALLTASWWSPAGFYADGQTRYVRFSRSISADDGFSLGQGHEGTGMGVSTELGYRFAFPFSEMDFEVVPQIQLMWSRVGFEDYVTPSGGLISLEDGELMKGRLGLSWDGEWRDAGGSGHIYGGVNLRDALDGRTAVRATGVLLTNKQISSVDGRLGLSYEWDEGYSVYGEAKASRSGDVEEVSANLGVKVDF